MSMQGLPQVRWSFSSCPPVHVLSKQRRYAMLLLVLSKQTRSAMLLLEGAARPCCHSKVGPPRRHASSTGTGTAVAAAAADLHFPHNNPRIHVPMSEFNRAIVTYSWPSDSEGALGEGPARQKPSEPGPCHRQGRRWPAAGDRDAAHARACALPRAVSLAQGNPGRGTPKARSTPTLSGTSCPPSSTTRRARAGARWRRWAPTVGFPPPSATDSTCVVCEAAAAASPNEASFFIPNK
jgi:hypothetical protein